MGAGFNFKRKQRELMKATVEIQFDEYTNEFFIQLPEDILEAVDFHVGDTLEWLDNKDGSWSIRKKIPGPTPVSE